MGSHLTIQQVSHRFHLRLLGAVALQPLFSDLLVMLPSSQMNGRILFCIGLVNLMWLWPCFGQATFVLSNRHFGTFPTVLVPILDEQGLPLEGTNYVAELWGGRSPNALQPARDAIYRRVHAPFFALGFFRTKYVHVESISLGDFGWLQVRVWDLRLGSTYEEAVTRGLGGYGESPLFYARGGGASPNGDDPGPLAGLQSFRLRPMGAVLMRSIQRKGDEIVMEWLPGFKRYQIQRSLALGEVWQNMGDPTAATITTNSIVGGSQFFRVIGLLD